MITSIWRDICQKKIEILISARMKYFTLNILTVLGKKSLIECPSWTASKDPLYQKARTKNYFHWLDDKVKQNIYEGRTEYTYRKISNNLANCTTSCCSRTSLYWIHWYINQKEKYSRHWITHLWMRQTCNYIMLLSPTAFKH